MGQSASQKVPRNEFATLSLQLDNSLHIAGDKLHGTCTLTISKPFPFLALDLNVKGMEEVVRHGARTETIVLNQLVPLSPPLSNSILEPGEYKLPFETILPALLPGSIGNFKGDAQGTGIKYTAKATLRSSSSEIRELQHELPLTIKQPLSIEYNVMAQELESVTASMGRNKGKATLEIMLNKNGIHIDDDIVGNVTIDNTSCACTAKEVICHLYEETTLLHSGRPEISPLFLKEEIAKWNLPGVPANQRATHPLALRLPQKAENEELGVISGVNIKRNYKLEYESIYDIAFMKTSPHVSLYFSVTSIPASTITQSGISHATS